MKVRRGLLAPGHPYACPQIVPPPMAATAGRGFMRYSAETNSAVTLVVMPPRGVKAAVIFM